MKVNSRDYRCILCNSVHLEELHTTKKEVFVTGDRKAFKNHGVMIKRLICKDCGAVQSLQNESRQNAVNEVYRDYDVMRDKEWSANSAKHKPRLQVIYQKISEKVQLPEVGSMVDIGCGGGESLFWFHHIYPKWDLYGMDIGEQFEKSVMHKDGVKKFFPSLEDLKKSNILFDFIAIHDVLSVADNPAQILQTVHDCLKDEGIFFIKDTDFEIHPWALYEIEGSSFLTKKHVKNVLQRFDFNVLDIDLGFEGKSIGVLSKRSGERRKILQNGYELNRTIYNQSIEYLDRVIDTVQEYLKYEKNIGIFGTSIAGVWVSELITEGAFAGADTKIFYLDEDEDALQRKSGENGYPIYRPEEVTESAVVFLPFPRYIANHIKRRCEKLYSNLKFVVFE